MGVSWGALAGAFLAPFLYGLYWKRTTKAACMVNFCLFHSGYAGKHFYAFQLSRYTPVAYQRRCVLHACRAGALSRWSAWLPGRRKPQHVREVFACYDRTVVVTVKDSIGDQT